MRVGIISDSHDHLDRLRRAMQRLREEGAETLLHAGDVVAPFAAKVLKQWPGPLHVIYGNNDGERRGLAKVLPQIQDGPLEIALDGRKILMVHDVEQAPPSAGDSADAIVFGHTHEPVIRREGRTLLINPGEVCGWLTGRPTAVLLDTDSLEAEVIQIE